MATTMSAVYVTVEQGAAGAATSGAAGNDVGAGTIGSGACSWQPPAGAVAWMAASGAAVGACDATAVANVCGAGRSRGGFGATPPAAWVSVLRGGAALTGRGAADGAAAAMAPALPRPPAVDTALLAGCAVRGFVFAAGALLALTFCVADGAGWRFDFARERFCAFAH